MLAKAIQINYFSNSHWFKHIKMFLKEFKKYCYDTLNAHYVYLKFIFIQFQTNRDSGDQIFLRLFRAVQIQI